jgi:hypothetical protein
LSRCYHPGMLGGGEEVCDWSRSVIDLGYWTKNWTKHTQLASQAQIYCK